MSRPTPTDDTTRIAIAGAPFDALFPASFSGREALSALGELNLRAIGAAPPLSLSGFTGQHATLSLEWDTTPRLLDALCTRAAQLPSTVDGSHYAFELRPWLWLLTLASNNRIFQGKTTRQIIEAVFDGNNLTDYSFNLTGSYEAREYCVQYAQTDFAFVSWLCEEEGWFYFFAHSDGKHTLTIADNNDAFTTLAGAATLSCSPAQSGGRETAQVLYCEIVEESVTGAFASSDYAYLTPASQLYSQAQADSSAPSMYEYPGRYQTSSVGSAVTKRGIDARRGAKRRLTGESDCRALVPGGRFTLAGHESADANVEWIVSSVIHDADHGQYRNRFEAFPADTNWRPPRVTPRPPMPTQTATVVGKSGEELWTDQYGRVKVQFHWDRDGKNDEQSSCWIRVAQPWASKRFGMQFMPRIGDEVVVTFVDADPDRPLITGSVYNGANLPPYTLPDNQTQSGIKTSTSKGGAGFNELRFEDKQDSEEVFLQAQKDLNANVLNDATWTIGHDETSTIKHARTHTVKEGDDTLVVEQGNRSATVKTGDETVDITGARTVKAGGNETRTVGGNLDQTITGNMTLTVNGNLTIKVSGTLSMQSTGNLSAKSDGSITNQAALSLTNQAGTSLTNKSDGTLSNEGQSVTNKGAAQQTVDGGGMLIVKGGIVKIN
ncbi:type VI secretion system tip protein VgrG [Paraburkholderia edwinii]|uniref:Type VI secretion system tip protein VgrG n=1 Tax=Paraburkholderia edwinii TaxID=2861782 RepID=A0ABX8UTI8_9BURK|nr:type VI secretion system tip protein TssI/VgrG [Paraburkholderia edwinii]QYD71602.1 type VI secretion system tip protein VgrG [Paraburkholderia edwinii]